MIYAGIGSRETPVEILLKFQAWGKWFSQAGFMLRSGKARGADAAFESGCGQGLKEIFTAQDAFGKTEWHEMTAKFHPNWNACGEYAKALHARNSAILFGENLNNPVRFILCWTKDGRASGGTGQALRIAQHYEIDVFNFAVPDDQYRLCEKLASWGYR